MYLNHQHLLALSAVTMSSVVVVCVGSADNCISFENDWFLIHVILMHDLIEAIQGPIKTDYFDICIVK